MIYSKNLSFLRAALTVAASVLIMVPAGAAAATPPSITGPTVESLKQAKPQFTVTNSADGGAIKLQISPKPQVDDSGDFVYLAGYGAEMNLDGGANAVSTVTSPIELWGGIKYYYHISWRELYNGSPIQWSEPQSFTITPQINRLRIKTVKKDLFKPAYRVDGTVVSNALKLSFKCTYKLGKRTLATRGSSTRGDGLKVAKYWACPLFTPSKSVRGKKVQVTVVMRSGAVKRTARRSFVAR